MLIEWKTDLLKLDAVEYGPFSLSSKFLECNSEFSRLNSCIYGPASNNGQEEFWVELNELGDLTEGAWCIGGDFNEVLYSEDRNGRSSNVQRMKFHEWVTELAFLIYPLKIFRIHGPILEKTKRVANSNYFLSRTDGGTGSQQFH